MASYKMASHPDRAFAPNELDWTPGNAQLLNRGGIAKAKLALESDPLAMLTNQMLGDAYISARRYDLAIAQLQKALDLHPNNSSINSGAPTYTAERTTTVWDPPTAWIRSYRVTFTLRMSHLKCWRRSKSMLPNRSIPRCTVIPELAYPELGKAIDWLCGAFGLPCVCELRITVPN